MPAVEVGTSAVVLLEVGDIDWQRIKSGGAEARRVGARRQVVKAFREGVVGGNGESAGEAFLQGQLRRLVPRIARLARLVNIAVAGIETPCVRAERAARNVLSGILIHCHGQVVRAGCHVSAAGQPVMREIAFNGQIPAVVGGRGELAVRVPAVDLHRGSEDGVLCRGKLGGEGINDAQIGIAEGAFRSGEGNGAGKRCRAEFPIVPEARQMGIIEDSPAAPDTGLAVAKDIPGKAQAWSEVVVVAGGAVFGHPLIAGKKQTGRGIWVGSRLHALRVEFRLKDFVLVKRVMPQLRWFVAEPKGESEAAVDPERILGVNVHHQIAVLYVLAPGLAKGAQLAHHEICQCETGGIP